MLERNEITTIRQIMHSATCAKEIKRTIPLFKGYIYSLQEINGDSFPDEALHLILDILSDKNLYTKKGIRYFLYSFASLCSIEGFSESQKNKVLKVIYKHYSNYSESEFCIYICEITANLYEYNPSIITPVFNKLYLEANTSGRAGIDTVKDYFRYRNNL